MEWSEGQNGILQLPRRPEKNVEYLIGMERQQGAVDVSPEYIARVLNVSVEDIRRVMEEMS